MGKKQEIFESRRRLDNTLSLSDLMNEDSIASLIKEQLIQSSLRSNTCKFFLTNNIVSLIPLKF
ncbi:hypothetical protein KSP40_PGU009733 [Platanthera guangdongensis]|uniref:Uncharacterized protein n=1 Tax=Platanthera guangdongensis TaxID=2320717 RepID=A0ABR2MSY7_9ASPA